MSVESYQEKHLERWLAAEGEKEAREKEKTVLQAKFEQSVGLYLLVLANQGVDAENIRMRLEEIQTLTATEEQQRTFVSATNEAMTILIGVETKATESAITTMVHSDTACFSRAMKRHDALSKVLRSGYEELGRALTDDRQIIHADPSSLNWQGAKAVFDRRPDLFGIEAGTGEETT